MPGHVDGSDYHGHRFIIRILAREESFEVYSNAECPKSPIPSSCRALYPAKIRDATLAKSALPSSK